MDFEKSIKRLTEYNGSVTIKDKTKEECEELIEAIEKNDDVDIIDEVADVLVMLNQLIVSMDVKAEVRKRMEFKVRRTEERLGLKALKHQKIK